MTLLIGAHVSIAKNIALAPEREHAIGGNSGQIFTHSPRAWIPPRFSDEDAAAFRNKMEELKIKPMIVHVTYLVNLGTTDARQYKMSVNMMKQELIAAEKLGLPWICVHPGSKGSNSEEKALQNVVRALDALVGTVENAGVLIENTAGMGGALAHRFEDIAYIMNNTKLERIGMVMDTCHTFAAGYNIADKKGLDDTLKKLDELIGLDRLQALHLNDSQSELGEHWDRHQHIGLGKIGEQGMRDILTHPKLRSLQFILETPENKQRTHADNIEVVRKLAGE